MRASTIVLCVLVGVIALAAASPCAHAQSRKVYVIEINGEVDLGMAPYVDRIIDEAVERRAAALLLHVNTFGGRVDVAAEVKDAILNAPLPVLAYVDKRAISAGAFITIAASKIAMAPGSTMGAATPVYGSGEKASEKVVSYMRSEMRATAERNKRDPKIAEAMVDETVVLTDSAIKKTGKLLTLTAEEAKAVGYCDAIAPTMEDALAQLGYGGAEIVRTDYAWGESLVRFFTNPVMSSILIMLGLGGLFFSVKTGHFSAITAVGLLSLALFFGAQYMADMATFLEVLMFVGGVALIIAEVFVIPGFGVAGISGILLLVGSLFLAMVNNFELLSSDSLAAPLYALGAALVGFAVIISLMFKYLPSTNAFNRIVLNTSQKASDGFVSAPNYEELLGFIGRAITTLRPAGMAQIGDERYDVITEGDFIQAGEPVKVVRVEGRKIVVGKG